jgi:flagellar basal-body rod protein FlgB
MADMPPLVDALGAAMKHLGARQRVIAQNIAHADTPGFKAREVAPPSFAGLVQGASGHPAVARPAVRVSEGMRALGARGGADIGTIADPGITETKPDGNNVTLEEQLLKMGQIQADFATLTHLYRKQMGLIKAALGKGGTV